jgi:hypothetical protein
MWKLPCRKGSQILIEHGDANEKGATRGENHLTDVMFVNNAVSSWRMIVRFKPRTLYLAHVDPDGCLMAHHI